MIPTIPASTSNWKRRAAPPSRVKIATPLPYGLSLTSATAASYERRPHDAQHRAEDLLAVDRHLGVDMIEEARPEPEPVGPVGDGEPAPVDDERGALVDAGADERCDAIAVRAR